MRTDWRGRRNDGTAENACMWCVSDNNIILCYSHKNNIIILLLERTQRARPSTRHILFRLVVGRFFYPLAPLLKKYGAANGSLFIYSALIHLIYAFALQVKITMKRL